MLVAVGVMGLTPAIASAEDSGPPSDPNETKTELNLRPSKPLETAPASTGIGLGAKLGLAGLVGAAAYFVYRRRTQGGGAKAAKIADLRVTARTSVGHRSEVIVVEVDGQRLLLGVTPGSIRTLTVLADDVSASAAAPAENDEPTAAETSLARLFASARREVQPAMVDEEDDPRPTRSIHAVAQRSSQALLNNRTGIVPTQKARQLAALQERATVVSAAPAPASTPAPKRASRKASAAATASAIEGQAAGLMALRNGR